jgi:uncharacterized glyoxalase superfamily protein PhnB
MAQSMSNGMATMVVRATMDSNARARACTTMLPTSVPTVPIRSTNDKEQSKRFFEALQQDGQVSMPLQETFFSPAYGIVTDKFGVTWQIYTEGDH